VSDAFVLLEDKQIAGVELCDAISLKWNRAM